MRMCETLTSNSSRGPTANVEQRNDYALVKRAVELMSVRWQEQPGTEAIAHSLGLTVALYLPFEKKLFKGYVFGSTFSLAAAPEVNAWAVA